MKPILKYLAVAAVLIVPTALFPNRVSIVLLEYVLTVAVVFALAVSYVVPNWQKDVFSKNLYLTGGLAFFWGLVPCILNIGMFKPVILPELFVYAFIVGLAAAGLYSLNWFKKLLRWAGLLKG